MEANSLLLEHTLVLAGEVVESGSVWQVKLSVPLSFCQSPNIMYTGLALKLAEDAGCPPRFCKDAA